MKKLVMLAGLLMAVFLVISGCKKNEEEPGLKNSYKGKMTFQYTRGFPSYTAIADIEIQLNINGTMTSGYEQPASFDKADIYEVGGVPQMKLRHFGTVVIDAVEGLYEVVNGEEIINANIHSVVDYTEEMYDYDPEDGFVLSGVNHYTLEHPFHNVTTPFSLDDAVTTGSANMVTYPDLQGTAKEGYTLYLTPDLPPR